MLEKIRELQDAWALENPRKARMMYPGIYDKNGVRQELTLPATELLK